MLTSKASISAVYVSSPVTSSAFGAYLHMQLTLVPSNMTVGGMPDNRRPAVLSSCSSTYAADQTVKHSKCLSTLRRMQASCAP